MDIDWGHILSNTFKLTFSSVDISTDCFTGEQFLQTKEVNRTFEDTEDIPYYCNNITTDCLSGEEYLQTDVVNRTFEDIPHYCRNLSLPNNTYTCHEKDLVWGILTLSCIQLPAIVISLGKA